MSTVFSICDFRSGRWDYLLLSLAFATVALVFLIFRLDRVPLLWSRDHAAFTRLLCYAQLVVGLALAVRLAWMDLNEVMPVCMPAIRDHCQTVRSVLRNVKTTESRVPESVTTEFDIEGRHFQAVSRSGPFNRNSRLRELGTGSVVNVMYCDPDSRVVRIDSLK